MKLETFFEKFELFADAPDAVAKMRELVLDLAANGSLLQHKDEWETRPLKSLATKIGSGSTPAGGRASYFTEGIPLIRSMNVHFRGFDRTGLVFLSNEQADKLSNVIVQANDVLLNITGASIGRVTTAPAEMAGARVNQHVTIIRPKPELVPRFLSTFLASPCVQRMINEIQVGATRQALTKGMIEKFDIPLPPIAEQERIVAKVDELMAFCDRLEAQQQERETQHAALAHASLARFADAPTPANLDLLFHKSYSISPADLRKSILNLAIQGKLVPQDPNDEPVSMLLKRLVALTAESGKVSKPLIPLDVDALPFEIPFAWEWVQAQDLCRPSSLITYGVLKPVWVHVGVPTVRVQDMQDGAILVDGVGQCSPERAAKFGKTTLEAGDLLIAKDGATLGKTAFVPPSLAGGNITQHVLRFPMTPHVDGVFVRLVIDSPHGQAWMRSETKGVALPGVNVGDFRRMPIPVPPLAEQRRIVNKVDELMALVDALEAQLATAHSTGAKLMKATVSELTAVA